MLSSALLVVSHQPHDQTEGLAVTPDGRYVFTNSRHCLYRSQDAGFVWEKANGRGLPHVAGGALPGHEVQPGAILTVSPQYRDDGGIFYVEQKEGQSVLYASHDGGASFRATQIGQQSGGLFDLASCWTTVPPAEAPRS